MIYITITVFPLISAKQLSSKHISTYWLFILDCRGDFKLVSLSSSDIKSLKS